MDILAELAGSGLDLADEVVEVDGPYIAGGRSLLDLEIEIAYQHRDHLRHLRKTDLLTDVGALQKLGRT